MTFLPPPADPKAHEAVREILRLADVSSCKLYLVGGYVRDALTGRTRNANKDFDFMVMSNTPASLLTNSSANPSESQASSTDTKGSSANSTSSTANLTANSQEENLSLQKVAVDFARLVADRLAGHFVLLDESNDTARVVMDSGDCFDFAGCVGGSIESDIRRRDFTINALMIELSAPNENDAASKTNACGTDDVQDASKANASGENDPQSVIDIVAGIEDIKNRIVRAVSEQSFIDDPLRLLRAFRFAAVLDFDIDETTIGYIQKHAALISTVAAERISTEIFYMLEAKNSAKHIVAMGAIGLLEEIFVELKDTRRVTKNAYHHLALFDHSVEALVQCERAVPEMPDWAQEALGKPLAQGVSRLAATKLASLLHDIGKPDTWLITDEGKHTFIGHDKLGAEMCEPLAKRLKWAKPVERFIEKLVRWHLRPGHLFQQGAPTDKAKYRFYRTIGDELPELVLLALSDFRATCGPGLQDGRREAELNLLELLANYNVYDVGKKKEVRFLDGSDLMQLLDVSPGPMVGKLLEDLLEAQALGEVQNRDQAAVYARKLYKEKYCT